MTTAIVFTRYLYEQTDVLYSLLFALLDRNREEALFWAYELYYTGLEDILVAWLRWIYKTFYSVVDVEFEYYMEIHLSRLPQTADIERDCIIGYVVSNLSHRRYSIHAFAREYLSMNVECPAPKIYNHPIFIQFGERDVAPYRTTVCNICPRKYYRQMSKYAIRKSGALFLQNHIAVSTPAVEEEDLSSLLNALTIDDAIQTEPYLMDWVYYAVKTPFWNERISSYSSVKIDHQTHTAIFQDDDECEAFYAKYGYEPDEQPLEIHHIHGIMTNAVPLSPQLFVDTYDQQKQYL